MSLQAISSFIASLGFPVFVAVYFLVLNGEDRKKNAETMKLINETRTALTAWIRLSETHLHILNSLSEKLDKILERTTILLERTCSQGERK